MHGTVNIKLQKLSALRINSCKEKSPINNFKNWILWDVILCQWMKSLKDSNTFISTTR